MKKILQRIRKFIRKVKTNKKYQYRIRYIMYLFILSCTIFFAGLGLKKTLGLYESNTKISPNIKTALYVVEPGVFKSNIAIKDLVPSDAPYIYSFTVANYNDEQVSDVDMTYTLELITTTNLPLEYKIYHNEDYQTGTNIVESKVLKQDEDNTWYNYLTGNSNYSIKHNVKTVDTFTIAATFPLSYKNTTSYTEQIENIEIIVKSKQVIEEE